MKALVLLLNEQQLIYLFVLLNNLNDRDDNPTRELILAKLHRLAEREFPKHLLRILEGKQ